MKKIILIIMAAIITACSAPNSNEAKVDNPSKESKSSSDGENQANSFTNIYSTTCLKYLTNLDALRERLSPAPKLPPEKAQ
jgi:hypothetical protein